MKSVSEIYLPENKKTVVHRLSPKVLPLNAINFLVMFWITFPLTAQPASDWKFESQRKEIAPLWRVDTKNTFEGKPTLMLNGGGKAYADGHWYKVIDVEPGAYFRFLGYFKSSKVEDTNRSILANIIWQNETGERVGYIEFPVTKPDKNKEGWNMMEHTYRIPDDAKKAKLQLHYRWDADGSVNFGGVTFEKTTQPEPRMVRLATIHHRPRESKSAYDNLVKFSELIAKAGAQKADIVCLPEGITIVGTKNDYVSASEPVPGPTTQFLGDVAKKNNLYIVAGLLEKEGDVVYNTSVLIDRKGNLAGKYRKVSLPREEIDGGVTPGNSFPVFDTDFGRIGMMICWDVTFPEAARSLSQEGAEIIFLPIWGGDVKLAMARAIENQVYLVSSTYDMISAVFDLEGNVIKEANDAEPVVVVDVNLNEHKLWPWLGDLKSRIPREKPSQKAIQTNAY